MRSAGRLGAALLVLMGLAVPPAGAEEIYRWVDENGTVHFSQVPPVDRSSERLEVNPPPASPEAVQRLQARIESQRAAVDARGERRALEADKAAADAQRTDNCERARANLEQLQTATRIFHTNDAGDRTAVGEEERQAGIARMQEIVDRDCQ